MYGLPLAIDAALVAAGFKTAVRLKSRDAALVILWLFYGGTDPQEAAQKTIEAVEVLRLSRRAQEQFAALWLNLPAPVVPAALLGRLAVAAKRRLPEDSPNLPPTPSRSNVR